MGEATTPIHRSLWYYPFHPSWCHCKAMKHRYSKLCSILCIYLCIYIYITYTSNIYIYIYMYIYVYTHIYPYGPYGRCSIYRLTSRAGDASVFHDINHKTYSFGSTKTRWWLQRFWWRIPKHHTHWFSSKSTTYYEISPGHITTTVFQKHPSWLFIYIYNIHTHICLKYPHHSIL